VTVPTDISEPDALVDEALDWVVRLKTGVPTRADVEALQRWRERSPAHEQAFRKAARLFREVGIAAQELADAPLPAAARGLPPKVVARRALLGGAIAASAAAYLVARPPMGLWPSLQELSADYRTAKGEQRKVAVMPDVSLQLNTQTSIALRSAENETRVELISGETSVAAALSATKSFVMLASNGRIAATKATFNARCLDGIVSVACLTGAVDVAQGGNTVRLRESEQVSYSSEGIEAPAPVDLGQVTAWQAGLLIFRDKPLANVVEEVNRYRAGKIIITNANLRIRVVNGTFQINRLDDFVAQVQQLFGAQVRSLPGGVVLLS
jgi:transmembrane sensor